jgi:hypothetical protein
MAAGAGFELVIGVLSSSKYARSITVTAADNRREIYD